MTARELLRLGEETLASSARPEAALNAELLLEHAAERPRLHFRVNPDETLEPSAARRFKTLLKKRSAGTPLAYLAGTQNFRGLEIKVSPAVLIPRPETEELAGLVISALAASKPAPLVLELCTGSGCLACALAKELPGSRIIATDISQPALRVARDNARRLSLDGRITFRLSDLYRELTGKVDCITANPPYVPSGDLPLLEKELSFEPALALDGGPDGLSTARRILHGAPRHLKAGGLLFLELGLSQPQKLRRELDPKIWDNIVITRDLQGTERFLSARLIPEAIQHG